MRVRDRLVLVKTLWVLALILGIAGCTKVVNFKANPFEYQIPDKKLNMTIHLNIPENIRNASWTDGKGAEFIIEIGDSLSKNAEQLSQVIFSRIVISDKKLTDDSKIDAILTPELMLLEKVRPTTIFGELRTTMVLRWTLTDINKNTIWSSAIAVHKSGPFGGPSTQTTNAENQVRAVLDELFQRSYKAILSSNEIKEFINKKQHSAVLRYE